MLFAWILQRNNSFELGFLPAQVTLFNYRSASCPANGSFSVTGGEHAQKHCLDLVIPFELS